MENTNSPVPCAAGCGFFGTASFDNMCSQCYKAKTSKTVDEATIIENKASSSTTCDKLRKRSASPDNKPTPSSSVPTPTTEKEQTTQEEESSPEKPVQTNKGRCFQCRLKVPLAKQAANKCRCGYVFCDRHRYPDRHDCDVDFVKRDREILAKNNPKLHERPRGGRSFQRIDSL